MTIESSQQPRSKLRGIFKLKPGRKRCNIFIYKRFHKIGLGTIFFFDFRGKIEENLLNLVPFQLDPFCRPAPVVLAIHDQGSGIEYLQIDKHHPHVPPSGRPHQRRHRPCCKRLHVALFALDSENADKRELFSSVVVGLPSLLAPRQPRRPQALSSTVVGNASLILVTQIFGFESV